MALPRNLVRLIESLRAAWPAGRLVDDLARALDIQPWRAAELIGRCEHLGLPVEQAGSTMRLDPARLPIVGELIELDLGTTRIGRSVVAFSETTSTNDVAWQAARRRDSDGLVVTAESQSAGRGRLGHAWFDRPGESLLFSLLLLDVPRAEGLANRLVMAASVAMIDAIASAVGVSAGVRWPNDVYSPGGRKLAGILLESRAGERADACDVVLGVGVNANQSPDDFPPELRATASSLSAESGRPIDRTVLLRQVLRELDRWLGGQGSEAKPAAEEPGPRTARLADTVTSDLHRAYLDRMDHQALRVRIHHDGRALDATVRDVDPINGLIVDLDGGGVAHFGPSQVTVQWLGA